MTSNKKYPSDNSIQKQIETINAQYGKLPPQAVEVEEAVLGACMLEREAIYKVSPIISNESFYKDEHRKIFAVIEQMAANNRQIDLLQVTQQLKDNGLLAEVGGPGYITQLTRRVASAAHIEQHARIIKDKFLQREMIRRFTELINEAYNDDADELEMMYSMHTQSIDQLMAGSTGMMHISQVLIKTTADLEARQVKIQKGESSGINSGLADLNLMINGFQPTDLIVIAARPSMGKTAIALHFAKAAALRNEPVCIFSLEMENIRLSKRLILSNGGINRKIFESQLMEPGDWEAYNQSVKELERLPIYIDDTARTTVRYIDAVTRNKVRKGECKMVIIDYLQLVETTQSNNNKNREREVAEISRGLKQVAKDNHVPVILLAQLNRGVESRDNKTPRLSDLRESGAIEQDADVVIFPWRPEYYGITETDQGDSLVNVMYLEIAKNREGGVGTTWCKYNKDLTQFFDFNHRGTTEEFYEKRDGEF